MRPGLPASAAVRSSCSTTDYVYFLFFWLYFCDSRYNLLFTAKGRFVANSRVLLLITELDPGGAERIVLDLATGLKAFSPVVAALSGTGSYAARLRAAGVETIDLGARSVWQFPRALFRLRRLLSSGRFTLLHTHLYHANIIGRLAAAGTGIPVIGTCHIPDRRRFPWRFWIDRLTARLCRCEVCVSEAVRKFQRARTGLPNSFYPVIYNGIELRRFSPVTELERRCLRRALHLPQTGLLVGFLGRFDFQKGADVLLTALSRMSLNEPVGQAGRLDFSLVLAGYGREERSLWTQAMASGWRVFSSEAGGGLVTGQGRAICFIGFQEEPASFLRCLDICVVPSRWEGFGLVAVEAQACGIPVIASDVDSLPEVTVGEGIPAGDAGALAVRLAQVLADSSERAHLSEVGLQNAARFSSERMLEEYARLYGMISSGGNKV